MSPTDELDYAALLDWYGLRVATAPAGAAKEWTLERRPDQTEEQRQRLAKWLSR